MKLKLQTSFFDNKFVVSLNQRDEIFKNEQDMIFKSLGSLRTEFYPEENIIKILFSNLNNEKLFNKGYEIIYLLGLVKYIKGNYEYMNLSIDISDYINIDIQKIFKNEKIIDFDTFDNKLFKHKHKKKRIIKILKKLN